MNATEGISRQKLDEALPYQVAVDLCDCEGPDGTLRRLYCTNINTGPGHETAVVHELGTYVFCFANLLDANNFCSQFAGKLRFPAYARAAQHSWLRLQQTK